MPTISYPDNANSKFDHTSLELEIDGQKFVGCGEISYSDELEPGEVYGTYAHAIGVTRGQYKAEASLSLFREDAMSLIERLSTDGKGWMTKQFTVVVSYSEPGQSVQTDRLIGCRIKKAEDTSSAGNEPLAMKFDLRVGRIIRNGKDPLDKTLD